VKRWCVVVTVGAAVAGFGAAAGGAGVAVGVVDSVILWNPFAKSMHKDYTTGGGVKSRDFAGGFRR
jgi:hypothetical protein